MDTDGNGGHTGADRHGDGAVPSRPASAEGTGQVDKEPAPTTGPPARHTLYGPGQTDLTLIVITILGLEPLFLYYELCELYEFF